MTFLLAAWGFLRNSWVGNAVMVLGSVLLLWALAFTSGGRSQRKQQKITNLENYADVQKRVDQTLEEAEHSVGAISSGDLDDRLRKHPGAFRE